jgi:transcriptional regulator with GAF, ATPase, and Fis domain
MSPADELRARLAEVVAEARAAGRLDELEAAWSELMAAAPAAAPAPEAAPLPGRFGLIGDSPPMRELFALLERVAPSDVSVLIQGETGTGKELVARALHDHSRRKKKPYLAENCAAISPNLLESELFGHVRGAFTGAVRDRAGKFEQAGGGTLLLDEIGTATPELQLKLLRVLEEGRYERVGDTRTRAAEARVITATNVDLEEEVRAGRFRADLFYRIHVIAIEVPPLRARVADVPPAMPWSRNSPAIPSTHMLMPNFAIE